MLWSHVALARIETSPLIVGNVLYVANIEEVSVFELSREMKLLAEHNLDNDFIEASPVFANGVLYVATRGRLYAISNEVEKK